jgi:predicted ATPase
MSEQGQSTDGVAQIQEGLVTLAATGDKLFRPYYLAMLAAVLCKGGRADEGLVALQEAMESYRESRVPY